MLTFSISLLKAYLKVNLTYQWSVFALFLYLVGMLESSENIMAARHLCAPVSFLSVQASMLHILYNVSNRYLIKQLSRSNSLSIEGIF